LPALARSLGSELHGDVDGSTLVTAKLERGRSVRHVGI